MRNCTWALLLDQETEQSVYVFSTHLHDPMGAAADEVRALQTQYLLEKAAQVMQAHPEASSLIMGDFNAQPDNDPASASKNCYNKDLETQINAASYQDTRVATEYGAKGSVHGSGCAQLRADGPGRDVRGLPCRTHRRDVRKAAMRRAGAIVPVAPVPVQDTALHIACGDERGFAQAVLTNDAAVLAALPPFEQAGALSNRLLADKTRLWFGDISGAQRCTETLEQLCERLRGYAYIDRQGKDGVVRAGLVGPLDGLLACHSALRAAVQGPLRACAACHPRLSAEYEH